MCGTGPRGSELGPGRVGHPRSGVCGRYPQVRYPGGYPPAPAWLTGMYCVPAIMYGL